ncbi:glycine rich domain-containing protein [Clostridioides difficile]|uniref:glycine rich domain-containing protein n=2 Tax=Clostridioides difficile TaxID=1496 RepID=UPI0030CE4647
MQTEWDFNYANYVQNVSLPPGRYKLECWGACGGTLGVSNWTECAKGGYSKGEVILKKRTNLCICVGQSGYEKLDTGSTLTRTGFNGGGRTNAHSINGNFYSKYGGGATDIRTYYPRATWDSAEGLLSRILVAGGGGGMKSNYAAARSIGHGGGYVGTNGIGRDRDFCGGGSQYQGGTSYDTEEYHGSLGKGGYGGIGVGGGGGWHGGAGSYSNECGGGGSGYALTKDSYKPPGYIPTSEYWLENVVMTTGGNTTRADGYAKITLLQALPFLNISSYNSTTATFKADHTNPTLLTKIEYFIDDTLKETITTDLTLEKTINYTLEDNALHTLKIVVTDSANATVEKVVSVSRGIAPLPSGSTTDEVTNKWIEIKDAFKTGKTSIINTLALKNIEASLNNTLVELSEKIKTSFDSSDASVQDLMNQLTQANNTISQLNAKYKVAGGWTTPVYTNGTEKALVYNSTREAIRYDWITISNLGFIPNVFYAGCDYVNSYTKSKNKLFVFACYDVPTSSSKDFVFTCDIQLGSSDSEYKVTYCGLYQHNKLDIHMTDNLIHLPAFATINAVASYYWRAIKIY